MFYKKEMNMLFSSLEKLRLKYNVIYYSDRLIDLEEEYMSEVFSYIHAFSVPLSDEAGGIQEKTVYKLCIASHLNYIFFPLPKMPEPTLMLIGPYIAADYTEDNIYELEERFGMPKRLHEKLRDYIQSLPIIAEGSHIFLILDSFIEIIYKTSDYASIDIAGESERSLSVLRDREFDENDTLYKISQMERRYQYENELIRAVKLGQESKASLFLVGLGSMAFEKRMADPVRNLKNYGVIMNTLLRKAAEEGGVHPIYIDSLSGSFARKIEQSVSEDELSSLMHKMFKDYCHIVKKHSMRNYSPAVQKAIIYIDANLSGTLTLSSVAKAENLSAGYLSSLFSSEVGMTITDFIAKRRIRYASHLLRSTNLQIQTISQHCGIFDLQYFSKFFKKHTGKTPKEYRSKNK